MSAHIDDRAAFISALPRDDAERIAAQQHAANCARCARSLTEAQALLELLDRAEPPAPSQAALARARAAVLAEFDSAVIPARRPQPARARGARLAWLPLAASVLLAWFDAGAGPLALGVGIECMLIELFGAALCTGAVLALPKRGATGVGPVTLACFGALGGQIYLHFRCPVAHATPHLAAFHVGGVVLAALLGAVFARRTQTTT